MSDEVDAGKRAELLIDHYKDTFGILQSHWKVRNRLFMYILILIAVIALDSITVKSTQTQIDPSEAVSGSAESQKGRQRLLSSLVNDFIEMKLKAKDKTFDPIDFPVIDMMARFLLLCLVIQYYQRSIFVDRQYRYIHNLESNLCSFLGEDFVTREGKSYFSRTGSPTDQNGKRPVFLRSVGKLYVYVFPTVLIAFVIWRLFERDLLSKSLLVNVISFLLSASIVFYNMLYLYWQIWERRTSNEEGPTPQSPETVEAAE